MVKLTRGYYSRYKKGDTFSLTQKEEQRLVNLKVAEFIEDSDSETKKDVADNTPANTTAELPSVSKLKKISNEDLKALAAERGIEFEGNPTKDEIIAALLETEDKPNLTMS